MFKKIFDFFKNEPKLASSSLPLYDFRDVTVEELKEYPNGIKDIYNRKFDGFIIRNVLSTEEASTILDNLDRIQSDKKTKIDEGFSSYPKAFSQVDQRSNNSATLLEEYFLECVTFRETFPIVFGVDFEKKVIATLSAIAGGRKVTAPTGYNNKGTFTPMNFRVLRPQMGRIKAHCGNYFHNEFPNFFSYLSAFSHVKDQLSYFVMLQRPESGGELTLFDQEWKDAHERLNGDIILKTLNGELKNLEDENQVQRQYITPNVGDMIIFAGGQIWHRVETVQGTQHRFTCGGFLSVAKDDSAVYYWT